mmetsp:Transcript_54709/g.85113  ORF Transcript_54709/g.85113 Transcript_54709/m.85113 type:complete len:245 (-) Transcript_54709:2635-3369(-)
MEGQTEYEQLETSVKKDYDDHSGPKRIGPINHSLHSWQYLILINNNTKRSPKLIFRSMRQEKDNITAKVNTQRARSNIFHPFFRSASITSNCLRENSDHSYCCDLVQENCHWTPLPRITTPFRVYTDRLLWTPHLCKESNDENKWCNLDKTTLKAGVVCQRMCKDPFNCAVPIVTNDEIYHYAADPDKESANQSILEPEIDPRRSTIVNNTVVHWPNIKNCPQDNPETALHTWWYVNTAPFLPF